MTTTFIDKYFINDTVKADPVLRKRGRMLAWVHLFWIVGGLLMSILHYVVTDGETEFPTLKVLCFGLLITFLFKRFGNFDLSANVLAFGLAYILVPMVSTSGGLYSDNMLWLSFCPMVVSLFGNKRWDVVWYFLMLGFFIIQFKAAHQNDENYYDVIKNLGPEYYITSVVMFVSLAMGIVWMFKHGNQSIFEVYIRNQQTLEEKHSELILANKRLSEMTSALTRSNKDLEAFASIASHDLKEPLRMVSMYAQLLKKRLGVDLTSEQEEFMAYIQEGTSHMQRLLDDILEYSRVGRSNERIRLIDLDDVVYYVQKLMSATILSNNAQIIVKTELPAVYGRYSELVQVIQNILSNAIKFRKPDVNPVIVIDYQLLQGYHLITITDNGIGMEQRYAEKVFQMFERLHAKSAYSGTGIGLALCSKIVQQFGGRIWLDSEPGKGTRISIELPTTSTISKQAEQN